MHCEKTVRIHGGWRIIKVGERDHGLAGSRKRYRGVGIVIMEKERLTEKMKRGISQNVRLMN